MPPAGDLHYALHMSGDNKSNRSAGILMFRKRGDELRRGIEVLLAHPGGPFWARKDIGAWTIPKGLFDDGEDPLAAAKREFFEETGFTASGDFIPLTPRRQRTGKLVHAWAVEGDADASQARSNDFELEWPKGSGKIKRFPEVDKVEWFTAGEARVKIVPGQAGFIDELEERLGIHED
jgi:predicted NUDIX family NTP pyrophosphohydrolase